MDASKVSAGKPKVSGAIYRGPLTADLPTDATTALDTDFVELGYASEDGVTNAIANEDEVVAWGGDVVFSSINDTFTFTLIEALNVEALKAVHGDDNVSGALSTGITVTVDDADKEIGIWVFEMILRGGVLKRIVVPRGKVTEVGDVVYRDNEAIAYEVTLKASADASGKYQYEYMKGASTSSGG